ncbi:MAG: hypothetical protein AB8G86_14130 [Saprospiraceae bacterium]
MRKELLIIVLCCSFSLIGFAQKNKDFILTLHKDTVFGQIKINPDEEHITFTHQRKRIYFHPKTLKAFGIYKKDTKAYHVYKSITNARGQSMFVEVLNEGKVNLYKYQKNKTIAAVKYHKEFYYLGHSDKKLVTLTPDYYEKTMEVLVKDHPDLLTKIAHISYREVPQIIASYNRL